MPKIINVEVYQFNELDKIAQQKAVGHYHYINVDDGWSNYITKEMEEKLTLLGFMEPRVMFSGFSSQGDGACFTCKWIDFNLFMKGEYKEYDIDCNISHNWRHYFATSTTVNLESFFPLTEIRFDIIKKAIESERERIGNEFYKQLQTEFDYLTSEKIVSETIEENEYRFIKTGQVFSLS